MVCSIEFMSLDTGSVGCRTQKVSLSCQILKQRERGDRMRDRTPDPRSDPGELLPATTAAARLGSLHGAATVHAIQTLRCWTTAMIR